MSLVAFPSIDPVTDESSDTGELVFMSGLYLNVKPFRKHALNTCVDRRLVTEALLHSADLKDGLWSLQTLQ